ncbi:hypothetical protein [Bradyrhizobium sp. I1.7.5]|uniref:hypothetical protein n=1 Tax=Bradyrhizobium sp. I1.7.5 TaxID=3156363 RepID=UPI003391C303
MVQALQKPERACPDRTPAESVAVRRGNPGIVRHIPAERYTGNIVSDLFGEERYFDDAEKFWKLQTEAVIHRQAAYLEEGWSNVVIMEIGAAFYQYDKVKRGKAKGGAVYISCAGNGEIGFHEGWLDAKEAARREKAIERSANAGKQDEKEAARQNRS